MSAGGPQPFRDAPLEMPLQEAPRRQNSDSDAATIVKDAIVTVLRRPQSAEVRRNIRYVLIREAMASPRV